MARDTQPPPADDVTRVHLLYAGQVTAESLHGHGRHHRHTIVCVPSHPATGSRRPRDPDPSRGASHTRAAEDRRYTSVSGPLSFLRSTSIRCLPRMAGRSRSEGCAGVPRICTSSTSRRRAARSVCCRLPVPVNGPARGLVRAPGVAIVSASPRLRTAARPTGRRTPSRRRGAQHPCEPG
jgi:hypothetical protein